jgi:predicted nucleic acid-binding protein
MSKSAAVIDSGVAVLRTLSTAARPAAAALWEHLLHEAVPLYAPRLWSYEVTSVIHKYLFDKILTGDEAENMLRILFAFGVNLVDEDEALCLAALRWASRLSQRPAYDAFYLALAESLDAELWTADRRLWQNAQQAGVTWVRSMFEVQV